MLKPKEDLRIRKGHLWVFSNEIAEKPDDAGAGDLVQVLDHRGNLLGVAFYHPHSLIAARLLGNDVQELDQAFFVQRIRTAWELRQRLFPQDDCYRLVHGESDFLPGLIVDRFAAHLVLQTVTAGMDRRQSLICDALDELFRPAGIIERNDAPLRNYEELPQRVSVLRGSCPETVQLRENGIWYEIDLLQGQKTGFFLDQKLNRLAATRYCRGKRVLDCFCNEGGFTLNAARAGALDVTGVEISSGSLERARINAALNGLDNVDFVQADVFDFLQEKADSPERYGVVILDPPSFARSKKHVTRARSAYRRINQAACRILERDGILVTASCSFHIFEEVFLGLVQNAALKAGKQIRLLEWHHQSPDHPILPAMPETKYLKLGIFQIL